MEFIEHKKDRDAKVVEYLKDGPFVYELYSILIHRGGAFGGHYYAYIKSFEDGKWYNFNDTSVSEISVKDIPGQCFGGISSVGSGYMLMYRQIAE